MEMFLMLLCMSLFVMAMTLIAFGAATRQPAEEAAQPEAKPVPAPAPTQFFVAPPAVVSEARPAVPVEALLLQIERHIRLEQAAAESFVEYPTAALLHSRTASPLVH